MGDNCPYHIPACKSIARSIPTKHLKTQMQGILTCNDTLGSRDLAKAIKDTPTLNINGNFNRKPLNRAKAKYMEEDGTTYVKNYNKIPAFCSAFQTQNEGSIAEYEVEESTKRFKTLTVVLKLPVWILESGGIPSAAIDGAHSKHNLYKGVYIALTGRESWLGKNLVIGIMAAPVENTVNYVSFANLVTQCMGSTSNILSESYMLWSDRDKGVVKQPSSCVTIT